MRKTISIIQTRLTHYRVPLFQKLREYLDNYGINLNLIHGQANSLEAKRNDDGYIEWAIQIKNVTLKLGGTEFVWQPALNFIKDSDLVIVTQENRILLNYLLLVQKVFNHQKIAFWGHGKNFTNPNPRDPNEFFRRFFLTKPDWWFAYTDITKKILLNANYPASKITVLDNAIDTSELRVFAKLITKDEIRSLRYSIGIESKHVGVFCGSLYPGKRMDILIAAARQVRMKINDFELIVIGAGPDEYVVKEAAKALPWIHHVGPRFGYEKVLFMKLGHIFLLPYMSGLTILESFTLGIPIVTMVNGNHGPEIAYLYHEQNGIITSNSIEEYANAICFLFNNPDKLSAMGSQCLADAKYYTIENMVNNFTKGIRACLQ